MMSDLYIRLRSLVRRTKVDEGLYDNCAFVWTADGEVFADGDEPRTGDASGPSGIWRRCPSYRGVRGRSP